MHHNNTTLQFRHIKFILWAGLIFAVFFLCSGCRAIFIPVDQIRALSSRKAYQSVPANIRVANFSQIGYGHIQAINPKQSVLLVTNASTVPPVAYTVNLLNPQNGSNQNFITSDKQATATVFQGDGKGVYYLNAQNTASNGSHRYQLVWSSLNRALTKALSLPGESVQPALCATDETHLLYADQSGHLIVIDSHQNRRVFNLPLPLIISKIYCIPQTHQLFFLGQKKNDDIPTFYTTVLKNYPRAKRQPLKLQIIDHKVTDFDWMNQDHRLVYLRTMDCQRQIKTYSLKTLQIKKITTGYFYRITALKRDAVIVSQGHGSTFSNAATLQYIDLNTKQQKQLTSPLRLSSSVFSHQKKKSSTLFFSVEIPDKSNRGNEAIYRIDLK
ncbi:hypothetical protein [Pseudoramibacter faecis]|uniref:hypothetical protein n=1 Tax=Pseudoramibacter faecis TaxID=3108534 RepID=UPI002E7720B6|nr:hypothetical protein [Pseudoramibacter sp. HA2172]